MSNLSHTRMHTCTHAHTLSPFFMILYTHILLSAHTHTDLVSYKLERSDLVVSELFKLFNSTQSRVGILDWGIKRTTLEDGQYNQFSQPV